MSLGVQLFLDRAALWLAVMRRPLWEPMNSLLRRGMAVVVCVVRSVGRGLLT
jgi:hypothetical protein